VGAWELREEKPERTLETPRMFISEQIAAARPISSQERSLP